MNVSVCIITKNEKTKLRKCLEHLLPFGFEIVVVDTGSTDGTKNMVLQYTDKLFDFEWIDDFAAAKNYAISKASNDMVMIVDSDEYLILESDSDIDNVKGLLLKRINDNRTMVGRFTRIDEYIDESGGKGETKTVTDRAFDRTLFHFQGSIHEQVVRGSVFCVSAGNGSSDEAEIDSVPISAYDTGLLFEHDGYVEVDGRKGEKARRNIRLLLRELYTSPDNIYILYQLGKSYVAVSDSRKALECFEKILSIGIDTNREWCVDFFVVYGYLLLELDMFEQALILSEAYESFGEMADYVFLIGLIYMNNGLLEKAKEEFIKCTKLNNAKTRGVDSYKAYYNAGVIEECIGNVSEAKRLYSLARDYEPAKSRCLLL